MEFLRYQQFGEDAPEAPPGLEEEDPRFLEEDGLPAEAGDFGDDDAARDGRAGYAYARLPTPWQVKTMPLSWRGTRRKPGVLVSHEGGGVFTC